MNRRQFLTTSAACLACLPTAIAAALDTDIHESPIMGVLRALPDRSGTDGFDFMSTHAVNHELQREVFPENPDMYWDPIGEDYKTIFGIQGSWRVLSGDQDGVALWRMDADTYQRDLTEQTLQANGWELVDEDLHLLHYSGSDEERRGLAESLNVLSNLMAKGAWDWVALPRPTTILMGAVESLIRHIADHDKNFTNMQTVTVNFHDIRYILRVDSYEVVLLPRQALPVESTHASFISRAWTGDIPIIQSIGLNLESSDKIVPILAAVHARLESETSNVTGLPYADFLTIEGTRDYRGNLRIDFVDSTGDWDIRHAFRARDLQMLPLT